MNFFDELEGLLVNKLGTIKTLISISKLEGRLAGLNVLPLLLGCILLFAVLLSSWLGLNVLLGYAAWLYFGKILWSLALLLSFNLIFIVVLGKYLIITLRKMSFVKTRKYFDMVLRTSESDEYARRDANSTGDKLPGNEIANAAEQSE